MTRLPASLRVVSAIGLVMAVGFALDVLLPARAAPVTATATAADATSGAWYCAVGDAAGPRWLDITAAAPATPAGAPAAVAITTFEAGDAAEAAEVRIPQETAAQRRLDESAVDIGATARWWDAPAVVTRVWRVAGDMPDGFVTGPCEPEPSDTWIVPGAATAGGAEAHLVLANPFDSDASVTVALTSADGLLEPQRLENVVVPARSVRDINLNQHAPERVDLGAVVRLRSGRVVAEGYQLLDAAIGGVDGVSLLAATPEPAETWTVPWLESSGDDVQSWLWVSNVSERPAALALTAHTADGGSVPEGLAEVTVAPGQVRRIDLREVLPAGVTSGGLTVRSNNGVPVAASVATQVAGADRDRTGIAVQLGASTPDSGWVVSGGPTGARDPRLHIANPGAEPAVVDVAVWDGSRVTHPDTLAGVEVGAGSAVSLPLGGAVAGGDGNGFSAFVTARRGTVVAGYDARAPSGPLRLAAAPGVPSAAWKGGTTAPAVVHEPSLTQRVGTSRGIPPPDPLPEQTPGPATSATPPP